MRSLNRTAVRVTVGILQPARGEPHQPLVALIRPRLPLGPGSPVRAGTVTPALVSLRQEL